MPFEGSYISDISHESASLTVRDAELRKKVKAIGGKRFSVLCGPAESMAIHFKNEEEKVHIIQALIDLEDIYFMHWGHSWPPSEVANYYREKGLVQGKINKVVNPGFDNFKTFAD